MVRHASEAEAKAWSALPSSTQMAVRKIASFFLMGTLLTILTPFSPVSWVIPADGPELIDSFIGPPVVLGAMYFHWRIAGIIAPITIQFADNVFMYKQEMFWQAAMFEVLVCIGVNWAKNELIRRAASAGLVAGLWAVGWAATPLSVKKEAWEYLKWIWTWMAIGEARRVVGGGRRRW